MSVLEQGFERLGECDVVIGPAKDGGYYLIGMKCMYRQLFEGIEWSTDRVFKQTCVCAEEMGLRVGVLGVLSDVDEPADLVDMPVLRCFDTSG